MAKTPIITIFLQTLLTKLGAMRAPKKVNRAVKTPYSSSLSTTATTAAETAANILQTFASSKPTSKPVVVSATVPK